MIEDEPNAKRSLDEDDDEVLCIINASTNKKLKDDDDFVMNIISNSIESNGLSKNGDLNDTNNNKPDDDNEVMNIIENSISQIKNESDRPSSSRPTNEEELNKESDKDLNNEESINEPSKDDDLNTLEKATRLEKLVPKAAIHKVETEDGCLHEVVSPLDVEYKPLRNFFKNEHFKPAKEYPFTVDPFQREAILCIENNESVLGKF